MLLADLVEAFVLRQGWQAEVAAAAMVKKLALALDGGGGEGNVGRTSQERIAPEVMLERIGVSWLEN